MWKPIHDPGPWKAFLDRKDNVGVPLMEVRKKYMKEQLLFENYVSSIKQLNVLSPTTGNNGGNATNDLKVSEYFDGNLISVLRYYRSPGREASGNYSYRNVNNFDIGCGYTRISWRTGFSPYIWTLRAIPCGTKSAAVEGPATFDSPLGVYGSGDVGPGKGYIVEPWEE